MGLVAAAALAVGFQQARANSIEVHPLTPVNTGGIWDYAYTVTLTAGDAIDSQSEFIFYDVAALASPAASFTPGATASTDWSIINEPTSGIWSAGTSLITSQGGTAGLPDSATEPNIRFQYVGAGLAAGATNITLGTANLFSTEAPVAGSVLFYGARWTDTTSGRTNVNTDTPAGPSFNAGSTPEPASLGLLAFGALGLLARRRR